MNTSDKLDFTIKNKEAKLSEKVQVSNSKICSDDESNFEIPDDLTPLKISATLSHKKRCRCPLFSPCSCFEKHEHVIQEKWLLGENCVKNGKERGAANFEQMADKGVSKKVETVVMDSITNSAKFKNSEIHSIH